MEHVRLGTSGLQVSRLCLGTMTFGYQCDEETSVAILDAAADGGITFIDTADAYPLGGGLDHQGRTEEILGRWLRGQRDRYVVATKCYGETGDRPWQRGLSRRHILDAIDGSLRRLGTDYVDLYQMHHPDPGTPLDETLGASKALGNRRAHAPVPYTNQVFMPEAPCRRSRRRVRQGCRTAVGAYLPGWSARVQPVP